MDIISPPATREEPVIDIDFGFSGGAVKGFTLYENRADTVEDDEDFIVLLLHDDGGEERVRVYRGSLAWDSFRRRTIHVPIDGPVIDATGTIAQPALPGDVPPAEAP